MQSQCQRTDTQCGGQCFCIFNALGTLNYGLTCSDYRINGRHAGELSVIVNSDRFVIIVCAFSSLGKSLCSLSIKFQLSYIFTCTAVVILLHTALGIDNRRTLENDASFFLQFIDGIVQLIISGSVIIAVALITFVVCLANKIQCTRSTQFFQNPVGIRYTRNFYRDTVYALFVYLCLFAVAHNTLLQLVDCVVHVFIRRKILISFVSNADTAGQIKSGDDVLCRTCACGTPAYCGSKAQQNHHEDCGDQDCNSLFFLHNIILSILLPKQL